MTKQRPICPNCGSADLSRDATARWCDETQAWTLSTTFDDTTCDDCGQETAEPNWIETDRADPSIHVFEIHYDGIELTRGWYVRSAEGLIGPVGDRKQANAEHTKLQLHRERLFNCCHSNMAPDWSCFASLTVRGCKEDPEDPGHTLAGLACDTEAEFWTVYGLEKDGCSQAITDCVTQTDAMQIAQELSKLSGLEIAP